MENRRRPRRRNGLVELILLVIGLVPWLAICALFVAPKTFVLFQWLGILMPFILLFNIVVVLIYLFAKHRNTSILLVYLLGIGYYIPAMFQWSPFHSKTAAADLRLASYNIRDMRSDYGFSTLDGIVEVVTQNKVDVLFLQEVPSDYSKEELLGFFPGMKYIVESKKEYSNGDRLAIISKYPLTEGETLTLDARNPYALFAHVDIEGMSTLLVNNHLQSTHWNQIDKQQDMFVLLEGSFHTISGNYLKRGYQAQHVKERIAQRGDIPVIVAGDFNDPPVSYSYHNIGSGLKDSFRAAGNGYGYTYRFLQKLFRIDYIFYDGDYFDAYNYRTIDVDYSDHLPVFVDLVISTKKN